MITNYFDPVKLSKKDFGLDGSVGKEIRINTGQDIDLSQFQIALLGLGPTADNVRKAFYRLSDNLGKVRIVDLGNFKTTKNTNNNGEGLKQIIQDLHEEALIPIIIGETEDLSYYQFSAYENENALCEIVRVEPRVRLDENSTLRRIILHQPNFLFNVCSLGVQLHYISNTVETYMNEMCFDVMRLGQFRDAPYESEPFLRSADIFSFDLRAVLSSEIQYSHIKPNGLTAAESCRIARYAGISNQVSSAYFYGISFEEENSIGAELYAQLIWYFIQGFGSRRYDDPEGDLSNFTIYNTALMEGKYHLKFLKSHFSERWWLLLDDENKLNKKFISCSYSDYVRASRDELPDRWWKAYQKLM